MTAETPTRRTVLTTGVAVAGAAAGAVALAACGTDSGSSSSNGGATGSTAAAAPSGTTVAALSDIPVGQAKAVTVNGQEAVVARPTETTAACFSAICTHQGCSVKPDGAKLNCPCHGSVFDALTGAVEKGPAETALPSIPVKVDGSNVVTT